MSLRVSDLVRRWGCGNKPILELIHTGKLAATRVGRAYRIDIAEVERYEAIERPPRRTQPGTPEQLSVPRGVSARHQAAIPRSGVQTKKLRATCEERGLDVGELGFVPDAYTVNPHTKTITLYEVVVTHGLTAGKLKKLSAFCDLVEAHGWRVGLMVATSDGKYFEHDPRTGRPTDATVKQMHETVLAALGKAMAR